MFYAYLQRWDNIDHFGARLIWVPKDHWVNLDASVQEVIHIATQRSKFFSLDALELIAAKLSNIVLHRVGMLYLGSAPIQLLYMSEVSIFVIQHNVWPSLVSCGLTLAIPCMIML
jgi:hypothetical protein